MIACREKTADAEESFKTLECLRGRLQAERQASRSAKKDAELMGKKLVELENLMKQEIKLKNRAEKKLILLKKKLESMKVTTEQLGSISGSSVNSTNQKDPEGQDEEQSNSQIRNPESSKEMEDNASESSSSNSKSNDPSSSKSTQSYGDSNIYEKSFSRAGDKEMEMDGGDFVDDTWALVPVTWPAAPEQLEVVAVNGNVDEVLDVLRRVREGLKCSLERRSMIRVGPACK